MLVAAHSAAAQILRPTPPYSPPIVAGAPPLHWLDDDDRSGPRFGAAALIGGSVTAEREGRSVSPVMSLFGWQVEHQFNAGPGLPTPMTELVMLVGGMEQGAFLPSVSWLVGMRKRNGWEAGFGPMLTGAGVQIAAAAGVTHTFGEVNVPVNFAVAPGRRGASLSITTGFNVKRGR
jgi:hypothetical protein